MLRSYEYVPAIPAPATQNIGDIYETADLKNPYALMRDMFTIDENKKLMNSLKDEVAIPSSVGESTFNAYSGGTWTPIPVETGHRFRRKLDTHSGGR